VVQTVLRRDPYSGHVFLFRGRRGDLVKLLWWDEDVLYAERPERGRFAWPHIEQPLPPPPLPRRRTPIRPDRF
jgi:transposase